MERDRVRLSKTIARSLRHAPQEYGLRLDPEGWVSVDDLLTALHRHNARWRGLKESDLAELIAHVDKRRFEIQDGMIRAIYGHSVDVNPTYERRTPPEILYHGTTAGALTAIAAEGLRPMRRQYVHLSPDVATARQVGARRTGPTVVLSVRAGEAHRAGIAFYQGNEQVWLTGAMQPQYLDIPSEQVC